MRACASYEGLHALPFPHHKPQRGSNHPRLDRREENLLHPLLMLLRQPLLGNLRARNSGFDYTSISPDHPVVRPHSGGLARQIMPVRPAVLLTQTQLPIWRPFPTALSRSAGKRSVSTQDRQFQTVVPLGTELLTPHQPRLFVVQVQLAVSTVAVGYFRSQPQELDSGVEFPASPSGSASIRLPSSSST